jgi:predicted enzyme related to lactoylglutathione lyase
VPPNVLFAGVATADLDRATAWYDALLGRPADIVVNEDEVMWKIGEEGWLYLVRDPARAGHALVSVAVPDLDAAVAELAGRGMDRPRIEIVGGAGRKAPVVDPEGNTVTLIEVSAPTDAS